MRKERELGDRGPKNNGVYMTYGQTHDMYIDTKYVSLLF